MYIDVCIEIDCSVVVLYLLPYIYKPMYLSEYCTEINISKYYDFYIHTFQTSNQTVSLLSMIVSQNPVA